MMAAWKIVNGLVLDGSGCPPQALDVAVDGDKIAALGCLKQTPAAQVFDASGCYVCPGFIDTHTHSDAYLLIEPMATSKIYQGVTTEVTGNCGCSAAPLKVRDFLPADWAAMSYPSTWRTFSEYLELLQKIGTAVNVVPLVGHGKLRQWVMGNAPRPAEPEEISAMCTLLAECLQCGARGMSTGLIYAPSRFAEATELNALATTLAAHNAIYTTHMRSEGAGLLAALDENIALARQTGVRVQISHLKTSGKKNWRLLDAALEKINAARAAGLNIAADRYPYTAGHTDLDVILPAWASAGNRDAILQRLNTPSDRKRILAELRQERAPEDWQNVIVAATGRPELRGRPLPEIAAELQTDPAEAALLLIAGDRLTTGAFFAGMSEENMWRILAEPYVMLGSDAALRTPAGPLADNHCHPRAYGTFPRFLKAALVGRTVPLTEAVRKITALPAEQFRLDRRGLIKPGYFADLVIFDPQTLDDPADYHNPHQLARGMKLVMVNGTAVLTENSIKDTHPGRIL